MAWRRRRRGVIGRRRQLVLVLLGLAACAGASPGTGAAGRDAHRVTVRIEFEPALPAIGELQVAHECGERLVVASARSGVDLRLLPGPVALTLLVAGSRRECALCVEAGMAPFVWYLDDASGTAATRRGT